MCGSWEIVKYIKDDFSHVQIDRTENLDQWQKMILVLEEKANDFYGYFNNHYSGYAPATAKYFKDLLTAAPNPSESKIALR